jgi:hypothetical protein
MYKTLAKYLVIFVSTYYLLFALYPHNNKNINLLISILAVSTAFLLEEKLNVNNQHSNQVQLKLEPNQAALNYLNKLIFGNRIKKVDNNDYPLLRE